MIWFMFKVASIRIKQLMEKIGKYKVVANWQDNS